MKKLILVMAILLFAVCICSAEGWDTSSPHFIFDTPEAVEAWGFEGMEKTFEMGNAKIVTNFWDPVMWYAFPDEDKFQASEYTWFAISMRVKSPLQEGRIYFGTTWEESYSESKRFNFTNTNDNKWSSCIVKITNSNWKGTISSFRIDPIQPTAENPCAGSVIYLNRVGFFKTEEEAQAFIAEGGTEKYDTFVSFSGDLYEAMIPANTLQEGYVESDFILVPDEYQRNNTDDIVVVRMDEDYNATVVPMSYTNGYCYTSYVADKTGKYYLAHRNLSFEDIEGHKHEEYIRFVAAREILSEVSSEKFSPDADFTTGMLLTALGRMAGVDADTDIQDGNEYAPYIKWAQANGIMEGINGTEFDPDEPATRADIALAINNFISCLDWEVPAYVLQSAVFDDLSDYSAAQAEAIIKIADIGIMDGVSEGKFAPRDTLTRAEMCVVIEKAVRAIVGQREIVANYTHEYITRDRIRIGMWGVTEAVATQKGMQQLNDLGVDFIVHGSAISKKDTRELTLRYADLYGIEVIVDGYYSVGKGAKTEVVEEFIKENDPNVTSALYAGHPSFSGHYFIDEPGSIDFEAVGKAIDDYEKRMPGMRAMTNLFPNYASKVQLDFGLGSAPSGYSNFRTDDYYYKHCLEWANSNNSDYISADFYPLGTGGTRDKHVEGLAEVAKVARESGREFWCCIQAFSWIRGMRVPDEADYRWQCYTVLSMGCTGILWWTYVGDVDYPALIHPVTLEPTQAYYDSQTVMAEIRKLSDIFIQYKSLGVYTINSKSVGYLEMRAELEYKDFDAIQVQTDSPLLVGCFEKKDDANTKAFTLVNMEELLRNKSAVVTVTINDKTKSVYSYRAGERQAVELDENGQFTVKLETGEGIFYTIE